MPTSLQWCFSSDSDKYEASDIELKEKGEEKEKPVEPQSEEKERKPASKVCNIVKFYYLCFFLISPGCPFPMGWSRRAPIHHSLGGSSDFDGCYRLTSMMHM